MSIGSLRALRDGQIPERLAACDKAVQLDPRTSDRYFLLGQALTHMRQCDKADAAYARALTLDPDNSSAQGVRQWNTLLWKGWEGWLAVRKGPEVGDGTFWPSMRRERWEDAQTSIDLMSAVVQDQSL